MYFYFYQVFMILSLVVSLYVIMLTWRRRHLPAAAAMIALLAATFFWTLGFYLEANSDTLERQLLFNNIGYLGSMSVPIAWFVFANNYTNTIKSLQGWRMILPCIIPLCITVLIWTNDWHHLMWSNAHLATSGPFVVTAKTYGPFFWVALAHNYLFILAGGVILLRRLFVGTPLYMKQAVSVIVAVCLPWIWNIIYVFNIIPLPRKDLTPVMFAISGVAIALGLIRFHLFTTIPFAREFIIQQLHDGVFIFDGNNCLVEANPMALKAAGADKSIIGKKLEELTYVSPLFTHLIATRVGLKEFTLAATGEKRFFELEITPMRVHEEQQVGWLAILHDITERKKMENQIIMQDRLASIGQLTSGVAHELNNPLTSVINFSNLLLKRELPEDIRQDVTTIYEEAQRTAYIVKNLLTFARKQPQEKEPINIVEGIQKVLELRAYEQKVTNIQVNLNVNPELPMIMGNSAQLQQVFFNLIINAEFFMLQARKKGTLTITAETAGSFVRVSFADDGPGISQENMKHLFSPFFTTKEVGKGTGLSLSICLGIITEHGGKIWAESQPGKGATFIVELPVFQEPTLDAEN